VARVEVQQILINLIGNAVHAMSDTPVNERRIVIQTRKAGDSVEMRIRDRGCGIPPDQIDRIFEPFHTTRADGLGMRLAICRRIAEAHGGTLHAANHESGGTVFKLPLLSQTG
jgi:C4-dicarboxylate-specific signal transduction histidine kinase